jgi:prephenate dehydrogenase
VKRILIAGYGKMGSWLWSLLGNEYELAVYECDIESKKTAPLVRFLHDKEDIISFRPDLFLNCVSITNTLPAFSEMVDLLPPECMLADIASVKRGLFDYYIVSGRRFVSIHPMFGPTFSDMNSPEGRTAYIISESDNEGKDLFKSSFEKAGIVIREVGFDEHDKLMATLLSVPVLTALLFSTAATERAFAGTSYDRFAKVSSSMMNESSELLSMILGNPYSKEKIALMAKALSDISEISSGASAPDFCRLIKSIKDQSDLLP